MAIQLGQTYRSAAPAPSDPSGRRIRIKVVSKPYPGYHGYGKVDIATLTTTGREVRRRSIETSQLHESATAPDGKPRRTGYVLEADQ